MMTSEKTANLPERDYSRVRMSFVPAPIQNRVPTCTVTLFDLYIYIKGFAAQSRTLCLRSIKDEKQAKKFKGYHLDFVLPSGVFSYCADNCLKEHSGIICIDLDHLEDVDATKKQLLADPYWGEKTLLMFRSPRGGGLKWFLPIAPEQYEHRVWFQAIRNYLMKTYGFGAKQVDPACANESRACWLCHDKDVYLKAELYEYF